MATSWLPLRLRRLRMKTLASTLFIVVLSMLFCLSTSQTIICNFDFTAVTGTQAVDSLGACPSYDLGGGDTSKYPLTSPKGFEFSDDKVISTAAYLNFPTSNYEYRSFGGWFYYKGGEIGMFLSFTQEAATGELVETTFEKQVGSMNIEIRVNGNFRQTWPLETGWQWIGSAYWKYSGNIGATYSKVWGKANGVNTTSNGTDISFVGSGSGEMWIGCHSPCPSGASFIVKDFYFQDYFYLGRSTNADYNKVPFNKFFYGGVDATNLVSGAAVCWDHAAGSDTSALDSNCYVVDGYMCELDDPTYTYLNQATEIHCGPAPDASTCGNQVYDQATEECEDGNSVDLDGCNNNCTITEGFTCTTNSSSSLSVCIADCNITNCVECNEQSDANSTQTCKKCKSGFLVATDGQSCDEAQEAMSTTAQSAVVATVVISVAISAFKVSSPQEMWISVHFIQMLCLLLMSPVYFPAVIKNYLTGMLNFKSPVSLLSIDQIPWFSGFCDTMGNPVEDVGLEALDVESTSAFVSNLSLVFFILVILAVSGIFHSIRACRCSCSQRDGCVKIGDFLYQMFWFSAYIRLMMGENIFLLVTSFSEIKALETKTLGNKISLGIAIFFALSCILFYAFAIWEYFQVKDEFDPDEYHRSKELFAGLKDSNRARWYPIVITTRKMLFVAVVVFLHFVDATYMMGFLTFCQVTYLGVLIYLKCFEKVNHMIIEVMNEFYYLFALSVIVYVNKKSDWNTTFEYLYLYVLMSNSGAVLFITLVFTGVMIVKKIYLCCGRDEDSRVHVEHIPRPTQSRTGVDDVTNVELRRRVDRVLERDGGIILPNSRSRGTKPATSKLQSKNMVGDRSMDRSAEINPYGNVELEEEKTFSQRENSFRRKEEALTKKEQNLKNIEDDLRDRERSVAQREQQVERMQRAQHMNRHMNGHMNRQMHYQNTNEIDNIFEEEKEPPRNRFVGANEIGRLERENPDMSLNMIYWSNPQHRDKFIMKK